MSSVILLFGFILALAWLSYSSNAPIFKYTVRKNVKHRQIPPRPLPPLPLPPYDPFISARNPFDIVDWRLQIFRYCETALQPIGKDWHTINDYVQEIKDCDLELIGLPENTAIDDFSRWFKGIKLPVLGHFMFDYYKEAEQNLSNFLLYCVARDCGIGDLDVTLGLPNAFYVDLYNIHERSWMLQNVFGWDNVDVDLHTRVYNLIQETLEIPARKLGMPLSQCLWHLKVNESVTKMPPGSVVSEEGLTELPRNFRGSTFQAIRQHRQWDNLQELMEMNKGILNKLTAAGIHRHRRLIRACQREITSEWQSWDSHVYHRTCVIPSNAWCQFLSIHWGKPPEFVPLRRQAPIPEVPGHWDFLLQSFSYEPPEEAPRRPNRSATWLDNELIREFLEAAVQSRKKMLDLVCEGKKIRIG